MTEILTTAPTEEPVTLAEAKKHLEVDHTDDDTLITAYIQAARQYVERYTSRAIMAQTWTAYLDGFASEINIHRSPVLDVTAIQYLDGNGAQQTLSSSVYRLDAPGGRITLENGQSWPAILSVTNAVEIAYRAGYRDTAASPKVGTVPPDVIHAIKLLVGTFYRFRETVIDLRVTMVPGAVNNLLDSVRVYHI